MNKRKIPSLCVRESVGSREGVPPRKNCPHLPPGGPQSGPGIAVMTTPYPCLPRPTSGHFSGNSESTHPRTAEVGTVRIPLGKKGATLLNQLGETAQYQAPNPKRFGIGSVRKAKVGTKPKISYTSSTFSA